MCPEGDNGQECTVDFLLLHGLVSCVMYTSVQNLGLGKSSQHTHTSICTHINIKTYTLLMLALIVVLTALL